MQAAQLSVFMDEIKVIHEDITDRDKDFNNAKDLIANAERIYLMGFGFGRKNVERLGLDNVTVVKSILAARLV